MLKTGSFRDPQAQPYQARPVVSAQSWCVHSSPSLGALEGAPAKKPVPVIQMFLTVPPVWDLMNQLLAKTAQLGILPSSFQGFDPFVPALRDFIHHPLLYGANEFPVIRKNPSEPQGSPSQELRKASALTVKLSLVSMPLLVSASREIKIL